MLAYKIIFTDIAKMNLKKKTRKRTRKFKIDGVEVTTTTSKIIYGDEDNQFYDDHYFRKQELRELKLLQVCIFFREINFTKFFVKLISRNFDQDDYLYLFIYFLLYRNKNKNNFKTSHSKINCVRNNKTKDLNRNELY